MLGWGVSRAIGGRVGRTGRERGRNHQIKKGGLINVVSQTFIIKNHPSRHKIFSSKQC